MTSEEPYCHIPKFSTFENSTSILTLSTAEKSNAGNSNSEGFRRKKRQEKKKIEEKEKKERRRTTGNTSEQKTISESYTSQRNNIQQIITSLLKQRILSVYTYINQSQYTTMDSYINLSSYRIHSGINTIRYKYYVSTSSLSPSSRISRIS